MSLQGSLGNKLRVARSLAGLSTRSVASRLETRFRVSHATVANYEKGCSVPPFDVLAALAVIYDRPINWFLESSKNLSGIRYRNLKSRTKSSDLLKFEAEVQRWIDAYVAIESRLKQPLRATVDFPKNCKKKDLATLALDVRRQLKFGEDEPIGSVIGVLEAFGIRVIEVESSVRIDGLAAKYGDEFVVALNPAVSHERLRLNAAHELAHVILGDCEQQTDDCKEQQAFEFASIFLIPNRQLKKAFEGLSMVRLVQFKERFGISLAAMVYRAEKLQFIKKSVAKQLWIEFSRRGWRKKEPGRVQEDRATRLEQMIEMLLASRLMSLKEIADLCSTRNAEIHSRLQRALGLNESSEGSDDIVLSFPKT
ncbi:MAG: ImmA/IrrE family metallo-endopeptidase [Pirellulaceae bacterium]|nr:ImmA/IrrE family metallo-endopeptidase [Pirellulaceae bacterium]